MVTGIFIFTWFQWGTATRTFDVICGRQPTIAEAALNTTVGDGYHSVGIRSFKTRSTPVSNEQTVDFGRFYWNWPGTAHDETMTEVTFGIETRDSRLSGQFKVTFLQ